MRAAKQVLAAVGDFAQNRRVGCGIIWHRGERVDATPRVFCWGMRGCSTSVLLRSLRADPAHARAMPQQSAFGVLLLARRLCGGECAVMMRSAQGTRLRPARDTAHGKEGSGLPSKTGQQATAAARDGGQPGRAPALIGPACMGNLAGIISCRHHKAVAAPGRATTHEPCPAHGAPEESVQAGLNIGTTEPGRRRGPDWRPSQGFQRTTHQRLMRGAGTCAPGSRRLKSSGSDDGSGVSGNGSWREAGDQSTPALAGIWRTELRVNLNVKYEERHEAKKHGALWDPRMQVWFVIDPPDMSPLTRWLQLTDEQKWRAAHALHGSEEARNRRRAIDSLYRTTGDVDGHERPAGPSNRRRDSKPGIATPRTDTSLADCGCMHVAPWEHCQHTQRGLNG